MDNVWQKMGRRVHQPGVYNSTTYTSTVRSRVYMADGDLVITKKDGTTIKLSELLERVEALEDAYADNILLGEKTNDGSSS